MNNLSINTINKNLKYGEILEFLSLKNLNEEYIDYLLINLLNLFSGDIENIIKSDVNINLIDYLIKNKHTKYAKRLFEIFNYLFCYSDLFEELETDIELKIYYDDYFHKTENSIEKSEVLFYMNIINMMGFRKEIIRTDYQFFVNTPQEIKNVFGENIMYITPRIFYKLLTKYPQHCDYLIVFIFLLYGQIESDEFAADECNQNLIKYFHIFKPFIKKCNSLEKVKGMLFDIIFDSIDYYNIEEYFDKYEVLDPTVEGTKTITEFPCPIGLLNELTKKNIFYGDEAKRIINALFEKYDLDYLLKIDEMTLTNAKRLDYDSYIKHLASKGIKKINSSSSKEYFEKIDKEIRELYKKQKK